MSGVQGTTYKVQGRGAQGGTPTPPAETFRLLTESGDVITTEAGDPIATEEGP